MTVTGTVSAGLEALVRLRLRTPAGAETEIDAVVDTGYTGSLTLPDAVVTALGPTRHSGGRAVLADGTSRRYDSYEVEVDWCGAWRSVVASGIGDEALVGMGLLSGHRLTVDVLPGGAVEVAPLSPAPES